MLSDICGSAGRSAVELTRRDVARFLLTVPTKSTLDGLPELRRELTKAANPFSGEFWTSAEKTLSTIEAGTATIGSVREWLEATGTEPTSMIPDDMFVWPEPNERGPIADEMHAMLVRHLDSLVGAGDIDPDRLVAGDTSALEAYVRLQREWLHSPLPDGRVPYDVITDEQDDAFLAEWDEAAAESRQILTDQLDRRGRPPCPDSDLHLACADLRAEYGGTDSTYRLLRSAAGIDPSDLPDDDAELWLTLAAGLVEPRDEAPPSLIDIEEESAWVTLSHADWIATALLLATGGPGKDVGADTLAQEVADFDFGRVFDDVEGGEDISLDDYADDDDGEVLIAIAFGIVTQLWRALEAVDEHGRLTPLGWWGIPESVVRAWSDS